MSLTLSPIRAPEAVRRISIAAGRKLMVVPALADEVLFVRLKEAPVDAVLSHVAEVLCAKWVKRTNGTTWLEPDSEALNRVEKQEADEKGRRLSDSLRYLRSRLAQQPEELDQKAVDAYVKKKRALDQANDDAWARREYAHIVLRATNQGSPAWRAVAKIVLQMDPKVLLALPDDCREVWAEDATPMQHEFSEEAKDVLKTYRRELNILDPSLVTKRIKLIFRKPTIAAEFAISLEAYGLDGKVVDRTVARMNSYADAMADPATKLDHVDPKPGEAPLQPSVDAIEARKAQQLFYEGVDRRAIVSKWRPKLLDPVRYEPTTWDIGEEMVLAAQSADRNLVGSAYEALIAGQDRFANATASQIFWMNRDSLLPSDDGWLLYRNHDRIHRISRSKAKSLLANCVQKGGLTVESASEWASQSTEPSFMNWICNYICLLGSFSGMYGDLVTMMNEDALRLWAELGPAGIQNLREGGVLQLSRLSPTAKAQIASIVFSTELGDRSDPTDRLPNGIVDGTLTMGISETPVIVGWTGTEGPPIAPEPVDAKEFGTLLAKGEPWKDAPPRVFQQYDRFRVGVHRSYILNLVMNPGAVPLAIPLSETLFNPDPQGFSDLPSDLKAAIEKARLAALAAPPEAPPHRVIPPR